MPAFIRKGNSSPGTGAHQKPGARRGCLLQSEMLLITSSLGSIFAVPRGAQETPNSYLPVSVWDNNSPWVSAHVPLLLKMQRSRKSVILSVCFLSKYVSSASLLGVCWTKWRSARAEVAGVLGPDLTQSAAVLSSADWGLVAKGWVPSTSRLRAHTMCCMCNRCACWRFFGHLNSLALHILSKI